MRPLHPTVRAYQTLRTAHLERAHSLEPASIVYEQRSYDFDEGIAEGLDIVPAPTLGALAAIVMTSRICTLEVNEPMMRSALTRSSVAIASLTLRRLLGTSRAQVVTYAIGNRDTFDAAESPTPRSRIRKVRDRFLSRLVARRVDRIAFGTPASEQVYERILGKQLRSAERRMIPALPAPCRCGTVPRCADEVVFLGQFSQRKGLPELLGAWPHVVRERSGAHLTLLGQGQLAAIAHEAATHSNSVDVIENPERSSIHTALRRARLLVLLSQRAPHWREQVGLPIVEGLGHGCLVLTTTETGLSPWLAGHGHGVIAPNASSTDVAAQILRLLRSGQPDDDVIAALPSQDGRLEADRWLLGAS